MHQHVMQRLQQTSRCDQSQKIAVGDLVLEITPTAGPLRTSLRGPFLVVELSPAENIAVIRTGGTDLKNQQVFKRHISHLVRYLEKPPAASGERSDL
jgi:hypothetical protein